MLGRDDRPTVRLHRVDDRPEWKVGCGWGRAYRDNGLAWLRKQLDELGENQGE